MTGLSVKGMTLSVVLFSLITIYIGVRTGKKYFSRFIGDKGNVIAVLILVIIGIFKTVFRLIYENCWKEYVSLSSLNNSKFT